MPHDKTSALIFAENKMININSIFLVTLLAPDIGWTHLLRRLSVVDKLTRELFYEAIYT